MTTAGRIAPNLQPPFAFSTVVSKVLPTCSVSVVKLRLPEQQSETSLVVLQYHMPLSIEIALEFIYLQTPLCFSTPGGFYGSAISR